MLVYYGETAGRPNVFADSPVEETLEVTLQIFRGLHPRRGFLGIFLRSPYVLQLIPKNNGIRVELLDSSVPAIDFCQANSAFAERLIEAAANGQDVFQMARETIAPWEHLRLG